MADSAMFSRDIPPGMPVYEFIKQEIRRGIDAGKLKEGERVPSELELSKELGISRAQARQALRDLDMAGYLVRHPGRGSFVAPVSKRTRRLGMKGFRMIAMALPELHSKYGRLVTEAFRVGMQDAGFHTLAYFTRIHDGSELRFLKETRNSGMEGIALWIQDRDEATRAVLQAFKDAAYPFVLCDRYLRGFEADHVVTDNVEVGYRLTRGLIEQGHTRIGFLTLWFGMTPTEDRLAGYRKALEEAGIAFDEGLVGSLDAPDDSPSGVIRGVLAHRYRPTALFCADDKVVMQALDVLDRLGYALSDDMALAAMDDDEVLSGLGVPMLIARQQGEELGRQTADLLAARVSNPGKPVEPRWIHAEFLEVAGEPGRKALATAGEGG